MESGCLTYNAFGLFRRGTGKLFSASALRSVLYIALLGVVLYLLLPQLPGLETSAHVLARSSELLLVAALAAEVASLVSYSEVIGRSVGSACGMGASLDERRRNGIGPWFTFRLAITGHEAGRLLPGGAVLQVGIALDEFRRRGLRAEDVGVALAVGYLLVYGTLGVLCAASFAYLTLHRDVGPIFTVAVVLALLSFLVGVVIVARAAHRGSFHPERRAGELTYLAQRLLHRGWSREAAYEQGKRFGAAIRREVGAVGSILVGRPLRSAGMITLALGYWILDALCMLLVFSALGVRVGPAELLGAYAVAQAVAALPIMPLGGLGVAEGALVSMLALLGTSPSATVIPVLGYRLFNYWMPILLAVIFYPTLRLGASKTRGRRVR
jgi:glycosyltransferase 2 family protein